MVVTRSVCECVRSKKIKKIQYQGIYLKFKSKQHNPKERMQRIVWRVCVWGLYEKETIADFILTVQYKAKPPDIVQHKLIY